MSGQRAVIRVPSQPRLRARCALGSRLHAGRASSSAAPARGARRRAALARATVALGVGALLTCLTACVSTRIEPEPRTPAATASPQRFELPADTELVAYRDLTRSDFQAKAPPPGADRARGHVAAATCAYIVPSRDIKFKARRKAGETLFRAGVENLAFAARMDPQCSWWDRANRFRPDDYVLEHEQIHFALVELVARDLNRRQSEIAAQLESSAETGQAALEQAQEKFRAVLQAAMERTAERSRRFDSETSLGFSREAQSRWAEQVEEELRALESDPE